MDILIFFQFFSLSLYTPYVTQAYPSTQLYSWESPLVGEKKNVV